jgi:nucleotide-binding universal stress UspA family protein
MVSSSSREVRPAPDARRAGAFRRILVGFDGSDESKAALRTATSFSRELQGHVRVLLVVRPSARVDTPEELARVAAAERDSLSRELANHGEAPGGELDGRLVFSSDPARALAQHAEEHGFDLIVVGAPDGDHPTHPGISHAVDLLVKEPPCPVLVV